MKRFILGLTVLAVLLISLTALAGVKEDYEAKLGVTCTSFTNHSGFVPSSYDVGVFIEDGYDDEIHYTSGSSISIPPPSGRNSWDTVLKCNFTDTTTSTSLPSTSTSIPSSTTILESTTTTPITVPQTTTTIGESTTTITTQLSTTSSSIAPTTTEQKTTTSLSVTTTTASTTSTSQPQVSSTTLISIPTQSTIPLTTPSTAESPKELPLTGGNLALLLVAAASLIAVGLKTIHHSDQD